MTQPIRTAVLAAGIACFAWLTSGSAAIAAPAGLGLEPVEGNHAVLAVSPGEVVSATEAALEDLGILRVATKYEGDDARVIARTHRGEKVRIQVTPRGADGSRVEIKLGLFGDPDLRERLFAGLFDELARSNGVLFTIASR